MQLNGLTSTLIYPGDQIKLPIQYQEYTVQKGDSLWKIAQEQLGSGTRYTEIMQLNHLSSDVIYPGQIFKLPIVWLSHHILAVFSIQNISNLITYKLMNRDT